MQYIYTFAYSLYLFVTKTTPSRRAKEYRKSFSSKQLEIRHRTATYTTRYCANTASRRRLIKSYTTRNLTTNAPKRCHTITLTHYNHNRLCWRNVTLYGAIFFSKRSI